MKNNFFAGRKFDSYQDLKQQLLNWLDEKCNARLHGTTRKVPRELFEEVERKLLKPLPEILFRQPEVGSRTVYRDCHIYLDYSYYSVPFAYVGKEVNFELDEFIVRIFYEGSQIAIHERCKNKGRFSTIENHYPPHKLPFSGSNKKRIEDKMRHIGHSAAQLFTLLLNKQTNKQTTKPLVSNYQGHLVSTKIL